LRIRLYGKLADAIGRELELDAPDACSIGEVRRRLKSAYPDAAPALAAARAVVAGTMVGDSRPAASNDTIEFLPVVSGG
jgi:molybdopterin converting factor small subunit